MAKKATANRQARSAKAKTATSAPAGEVVKGAAVHDPRTDPATQELQGANGAEASAGGAAATSGEAEAKAAGAGTESAAADPVGTAGAPAASAEQSREQTTDASADRKDASGGETQPGDTVQPPVAGPDLAGATIVVTGPKKGRYRGGIRFGPDPVSLDPDEFVSAEGEPRHVAGERLYSILTDPSLHCVIRQADGTEVEFEPAAIEAIRGAIDEAKASEAKVSGSIHLSYEGATAADIAEIKERLDQLQNDLPGIIVATMRDARSRFLMR